MSYAVKKGAVLDPKALASLSEDFSGIDAGGRALLTLSGDGQIAGVNEEGKRQGKLSKRILFSLTQQSILAAAPGRVSAGRKGHPCAAGKSVMCRIYPAPAANDPNRSLVIMAKGEDYPALMQDMTDLNTRNYLAAISLQKENRAARSRNRKLEQIATTDPLTQLNNRQSADQSFGALVSIADRQARGRKDNKYVAVIVADIDHFKSVNDTHGHDAGDKALKFVAGILKSKKRKSDTVIRWGGEEMVIIALTNGKDGAIKLAERIRKGIAAKPLQYGDKTIQLRASFGVTLVDPLEEPTTLAKAVARADTGLYKAKKGGRNQVVFADAPEPELIEVPEASRSDTSLVPGLEARQPVNG